MFSKFDFEKSNFSHSNSRERGTVRLPNTLGQTFFHGGFAARTVYPKNAYRQSEGEGGRFERYSGGGGGNVVIDRAAFFVSLLTPRFPDIFAQRQKRKRRKNFQSPLTAFFVGERKRLQLFTKKSEEGEKGKSEKTSELSPFPTRQKC